ncbi:hypothetical protein Trydic_g10756 [Trypoxylus dichotomus]
MSINIIQIYYLNVELKPAVLTAVIPLIRRILNCLVYVLIHNEYHPFVNTPKHKFLSVLCKIEDNFVLPCQPQQVLAVTKAIGGTHLQSIGSRVTHREAVPSTPSCEGHVGVHVFNTPGIHSQTSR